MRAFLERKTLRKESPEASHGGVGEGGTVGKSSGSSETSGRRQRERIVRKEGRNLTQLSYFPSSTRDLKTMGRVRVRVRVYEVVEPRISQRACELQCAWQGWAKTLWHGIGFEQALD